MTHLSKQNNSGVEQRVGSEEVGKRVSAEEQKCRGEEACSLRGLPAGDLS